tara:strand:+ start:2524 stop:2733 length:210 start_codon:yes stop_codon:yes gene_type:complete
VLNLIGIGYKRICITEVAVLCCFCFFVVILIFIGDHFSCGGLPYAAIFVIRCVCPAWASFVLPKGKALI